MLIDYKYIQTKTQRECSCPDQTIYTKQIEDAHDIKLFIYA